MPTPSTALWFAGLFILIGGACRPPAPVQPLARPADTRSADRDGDGLADQHDHCPQARGVEPDGCPIPDADGEGRLDPGDLCPDLPETPNGFQEDDGCPDEIPVSMANFTGTIEGIYFDTLKVTIKQKSKVVLDNAVRVLKDFATINIEISCHESTDPGVSTPVYAPSLIKFTLRRANTVKRYLVERGIAPERIEVRGAGSDEPLETNATARGRAMNRRCEFTMLVQ